MNVEDFERGAKIRGLKIIDRAVYKDMSILVADGYVSSSPDFPNPHYLTMFAVGRDTERLDVACPNVYEVLKDPLGFSTLSDKRRDDAIAHAKKFIDKCKRVNQYDA